MPALDCKTTREWLDRALDGELGESDARAFFAHAETCPACQAAVTARRALSVGLKADLDRFKPSADLKARILAALPEGLDAKPARPRRGGLWWAGTGGAGFGAALAACIVLFLVMPPSHDELAKELVAAHVRSLMANHLTDVVSSDQHTVKPWFNGRVDLSPPVPDLAEQGYPIVGGRLDYIHEHTVAALVYRHRQHLINLFVWPEPGTPDKAPSTTTRNGYHVVDWREDGVAYAIVSDVNPQNIDEFRHLWTTAAFPKE